MYDVNCIEDNDRNIIVQGKDAAKIHAILKKIENNDTALTTPYHGQFQFNSRAMNEAASNSGDPDLVILVWDLTNNGRQEAVKQLLNKAINKVIRQSAQPVIVNSPAKNRGTP